MNRPSMSGDSAFGYQSELMARIPILSVLQRRMQRVDFSLTASISLAFRCPKLPSVASQKYGKNTCESC